MVLGSLSFSVIMHFVESGDLDIVDHLQGGLLNSALMLVPFFWLLTLILFAISAYFNWRCTKIGYHYRRRWIVLGSIALSVVFGSIFYVVGLGKQTDNIMSRMSPFYDQYKHRARNELWLQPEKGLLTGKIIDIDEETEKLIVRDEDGKKWIVDDLNVKWENKKLEENGKIIKVIGEKNGEYEFRAREIRRCNNCQDDEFIEEKPVSVCGVKSEGNCKE
ncbi:MAG: hypothetical protein US63_C0001G0015 [Candidatus Moranbacteria bacterium GW2011_GWC2_37_8]|nr:MAG: hypothetical protein US63_C0001G0015 [Candidatus Moranbacteria bacterium GW2011_GWC2_37_8]KKQ63066.1 MAG: hypothetical protein US82_C0003G0015 [Parcubacteria group bacterium GW2011_GWC1_38_22]